MVNLFQFGVKEGRRGWHLIATKLPERWYYRIRFSSVCFFVNIQAEESYDILTNEIGGFWWFTITIAIPKILAIEIGIPFWYKKVRNHNET